MRNSGLLTITMSTLLILLLLSCGWPFGQETNPHVEIIVPLSEKPDRNWNLSPHGDKIIYKANTGKSVKTILLFPETGQTYKLDFCSPFTWLDNNLLQCPEFFFVTDDLLKLPLKEVNVSKTEFVELLQDAGLIYKFEENQAEDDWVYILDSKDHQHNSGRNFKVIVDNVDEILEEYDSAIIPKDFNFWGDSEYSPNGEYYYVLDDLSLTIFDAVTREMVITYTEDPEKQPYFSAVKGWAADSSGVYFQVTYGGGFGSIPFGAIKKLKVPEQLSNGEH